MRRFIFYFISCVFPVFIQAQSVNVLDYGVSPNSFQDASEGVKEAIKAVKLKKASKLIFPEGRYDFWPEKTEKREFYISNTSSEEECPSKIKNIGLLFEDINDLTIEGNGARFVFHGKMITYALHNCKNIIIQNLSIDFERPSMSEMKLIEVLSDQLTVEVHPDSKYEVTDNTVYFYGEGWGMNHYHTILSDTLSGINVYSSWKPISQSKATVLAPFKIQFEGDYSKSNYTEGQILTVRDPIRDHVGVFINRSENIQLQNLSIHYMHGLGIVSQFSENLFFHQVNIVPSRGRAISSFADGMHFSGCKGQIDIDNCHFRGLHDDPVNIHGTYLQVVKIDTPTSVIVRFMHHQTYGFQPFYIGDTIAYVSAAAIETKGIGVVKKVQQISEREIKLELSAPLPPKFGIGDCIENLTWTPSVHIRKSRFEMTNARGLLITTPGKVVIEDNVFFRTGMYGILIAGDVNSWFESGAVTDVTIRNNIFDNCGYNQWPQAYSIAIEPEIKEGKPGYWIHRNIFIENNTFNTYSGQVLKAKSVEGLFFRNNKIKVSSLILNGKSKEASPLINLENCTKVTIKQNDIEQNTGKYEIKCSSMRKKDIRSGDLLTRFLK